MSSRYDELPPPLPRSPLEPVPPPSRAKLVAAIALVLLTAAIGVAAAFGLDFCPYVRAVGISLDACAVPVVPTP